MSSFVELQAREIKQARAQYPDMNSLHEGWAVLYEEVDELWKQVKFKQFVEATDEDRRRGEVGKHYRNPAEITEELVQIAAMAQRIYEDIVETGRVHK